VFNQGVGQRVIFEDAEAIRIMGGLLRKEVRARRIEILSHCFMTTHFHLGLISLVGKLSEVLQRIESCFARWFNRKHGRNGPVFRGRFGSRQVKDETHLTTLIRYIDANPVMARIVEFPEEYPHGSAGALLRGPTPDWLSKEWFDRDLEDLIVRGMSWAEAYRTRYGGLSRDEIFLVEQRMRNRPSPAGYLDDLVGAAPPAVRAWFEERARTADGGIIAAPIVGPDAVDAVLVEPRAREPNRMVRLGRRGSCMWPVLRVGLLRYLCAMSLEQVGERVGCSTTTAHHRYRLHLRAMRSCEDYATVFTDLATRLLAR